MTPSTLAIAIIDDRQKRGVPTTRPEHAELVKLCGEVIAALRRRGRLVLQVDAGASLSRRQRQLIRILQDRSDAGRPMPSQSELAQAMGTASVSQIHGIKHALVRLGWLAIEPNQARAITLLKRLPKRGGKPNGR